MPCFLCIYRRRWIELKKQKRPKLDAGASVFGRKEPTPIKASFFSSFLNHIFYVVSSSSRLRRSLIISSNSA